MAVRVNIPIQVEAGADLLRADASAALVARVAAAVKQGLEFMAAELAADGHPGEPVIHEPTLHWSGPGLGALPAADRAVTGARLIRAVQQTSRAFAAHARDLAKTRAASSDAVDVVLDHPIAFRTTPRRFFQLLIGRRADLADREARYLDLLDLPHDGVVFRVRTHGMMSLDQLHQALARELHRQLRGDAHDYFVAVAREDVSKIVGLDLHHLAGLGTAHVSTPARIDGVDWVAPSSQLFVACLRLPPVEVDTVTAPRPAAHLTIALRELEPYIVIKPFREVTGVSWESYRAEWGQDLIPVTIYPFSVLRRTHGRTLQALFAERSRHEGHDGLQLGGIALLTRAAVNLVPALRLSAYSDDVTRALPGAKVDGPWEVGWKGAYVSAWLAANDFKLAAARHRAAARALARQIVDVLNKRDPGRHELRRLIVSAYGESGAAIEHSAEAFPFLLDALEELPPKNTWLTRLYDASRLHDCQELLVQLAHGTRYANHPAVKNAAARVAARHAAASIHFYVPGTGVQIHRSWMLRYGHVLGAHNELYLIKSKRGRIKQSSEAKIPGWFQKASQRVVERMVAGESQSQAPDRLRSLAGAVTSIGTVAVRKVEPLKPELTPQELMSAVLDEMQKLVTPDDIEEVEVQRSIRLLGVRDTDDHGVTRHWVKFAWVERVPADVPKPSDGVSQHEAQEDGWVTLRESNGKESIEELEAQAYGGFEELLFRWEFQQSAIVAQVELKLVGYAIAIFGAVELGALELAPHALGFIGFNLAVYLIKWKFFGGELTVDGLMLEVVKGYAMALGFGVFAPLGKLAGIAVARLFTVRWVANTIARYLLRITGYVAQRLVSGSITGAGAMAVTQLATDLVLIAMGARSGFSSWDEYLHAMKEGAKLGILFEFGGDAFGVLAKTESFAAVASAVRRAGWSPAKWLIEVRKARVNLNQWLTEMASRLGKLNLEGLKAALDKMFTELGEAVVEGTKRALLRRIIELSKTELTPLGASGLAKLIEALEADAAEPLLHALAKDASRAARFLEALGRLDEGIVAVLANKGQLAALAESARVIDLMWSRPYAGLIVLDALGFDVAAAEHFLTDLAKLPGAAFEQGLQLIKRDVGYRSPALILRALHHPGLRGPGLAGLLDHLADAGLATSDALGDLLAALEHLDAVRRGGLTASHMRALAHAPQLLGLLRRAPSLGWRLLEDVFGGAVGDCEAFLARFATAPPAALDNAVAILTRAGNALPRDAVAALVLRHGSLTADEVALLADILRDDPSMLGRLGGRADLVDALKLARGNRALDLELAFLQLRLKGKGVGEAEAGRLIAAMREAGVAPQRIPGYPEAALAKIVNPAVIAQLEVIGKLQKSGRVKGLDDWIDAAKTGATDPGEMAHELREAIRQAQAKPDKIIHIGGDNRAPIRPGTTEKMRSFDMTAESKSGTVSDSVEVTGLDEPIYGAPQLHKPIEHATKKIVDRAAGQQAIPGRHEVTVLVELGKPTTKGAKHGSRSVDPTNGDRILVTAEKPPRRLVEGNLYKGIEEHLSVLGNNQLLDVVTLVDRTSGKPLARFVRNGTKWELKP